MVVIIRHYLVDSENVNDNWLMLLELAEAEDEIIVFYTKNSPHMSYASVVKILQLNRPIKFEECYEGNNGLDFQLISYLGYLMKNEGTDSEEFIIMSNDTGFDPAVSFWKDRKFSVKRINVNYCKMQFKQQSESVLTELEEISESEEVAPSPAPVTVEAPEAPSTKTQYNFNKEEVDTLINCIGKTNLTTIHETLVHVYGQKQGQTIYKTVKEKAYPMVNAKYPHKDKVKYFSDIVFSHGELKNPGNFVDFLEKNKDKTKNLNGIRAAIVKSYGEGNGMKYYSLFKPYFKIISAIN